MPFPTYMSPNECPNDPGHQRWLGSIPCPNCYPARMPKRFNVPPKTEYIHYEATEADFNAPINEKGQEFRDRIRKQKKALLLGQTGE